MNCLLQKKTESFLRQPSFKKLDLSDRAVLEKFLSRFPQRISGFTFATLFTWNPTYRYEWATCGADTVFITCWISTDEKRHFLQPVGGFDPEAQGILLGLLEQLPYPAHIFGVGAEFIRDNPEFVSRFTVQNDPALANYTYRSSDLALLSGKFYAKKRNLIAQAHNIYKWSAQPLTPDNAAACLDVLGRMETPSDETGKNEETAVRTAIRHFADLALQGVLIKVGDEAVAFSVFELLSQDTAVIHFEKADRHYKGLYQIINQETAKLCAASGFSLINREEDMGVPGLRQAKESYGPSEVVPSYTLMFKR